jgi:predicted ribosomally synthesized peptide with nif11-like leader
MSELVRFNEAVKSSESMQNDIKAMGNDLDKIIAYAKANGFSFEVEDVTKLSKEDQVLSDEDLDTVAGGTVVATGIANALGTAVFIF